MVRRLAAALFLLLGFTGLAQASDPVLDVLRTQLDIEKRLLTADLSSYEKLQQRLNDTGDRLVRVSADLVRAERDGEDIASLAARSADVSRTENEMASVIATAQQVRGSITSRRNYIELLQAEVRRLEEGSQAGGDDLTGRWNLFIEPGGLKGTMDLRLDGTLVSGVYQLSGGWKGSMRGTLIGEQVHMERIDAQQGFVAVYNGRLVTRGGEKRIEGVWEATGLTTGQPAAGTWVARREPRS
jgi:hypothetical protein